MCIEPTAYFVKKNPPPKRQEAEFIPGKLLTRYTSSLDQVMGDLKVESDGSDHLPRKKEGNRLPGHYRQLPGGQQEPFLFTVKDLVAKSQPGLSAPLRPPRTLKGTIKYRLTALLTSWIPKRSWSGPPSYI